MTTLVKTNVFFGFEYKKGQGLHKSNRRTKTGKRSVNGKIHCFRTKKKLDDWVVGDYDKSVFERMKTGILALRHLCQGMTADEFNTYLLNIEYEVICY